MRVHAKATVFVYIHKNCLCVVILLVYRFCVMFICQINFPFCCFLIINEYLKCVCVFEKPVLRIIVSKSLCVCDSHMGAPG